MVVVTKIHRVVTRSRTRVGTVPIENVLPISNMNDLGCIITGVEILSFKIFTRKVSVVRSKKIF